MYSTVVSDVGTVRSNNQDSAFAGEHLIAICDGMGGHAGGDTASTIAIRSLAHIEQDNVQGDVQIIAHTGCGILGCGAYRRFPRVSTT